MIGKILSGIAIDIVSAVVPTSAAPLTADDAVALENFAAAMEEATAKDVDREAFADDAEWLRAVAARIRAELAQVESLKKEVSDAWDLYRDIAALQERVAFTEQARDNAVVQRDEAIRRRKEGGARAGRVISQLKNEAAAKHTDLERERKRADDAEARAKEAERELKEAERELDLEIHRPFPNPQE